MTEAEWEATQFPRRLLAALGDSLSVRKQRLLGVAACRLLPPEVLGGEATRLFESAERLAERPDVTVTGKVLSHHLVGRRLSRRLCSLTAYRDGIEVAIREMFRGDAMLVVGSLGRATGRIDPAGEFEHRDMPLSDVVRDIVGYPFRSIAFSPTWRTATTVAIAAGAYADRAFERLPVLADALEDAGCDSEPLLAHLRGPGPHARGCWALDAVLGKT